MTIPEVPVPPSTLAPQAGLLAPAPKVKRPNPFSRYFSALRGGVTPEDVAYGTRKGVRTFFQAALPIVVAAGAGAFHGSVALGAALAGGAAVAALVQNTFGK